MEYILLFNRSWDLENDLNYNYLIKEGYYFTTDRKYYEKASIVIFHMPTIDINNQLLVLKKLPFQKWVFWSMECELNYPSHYDNKILNLFDTFATYKFSSDVPVPYIYKEFKDTLKKLPKLKSENCFINAFISSSINNSEREEYLKELMSYLKIHSYGKFQNNIKLIDDRGGSTKAETIAKYKFTIAFENSIAEDYVTEKFFDPLEVGSVPIYLGAPNIDEFAPGENCFINVKNFPSVEDLANHLIVLNRDDELYNQHFKWKNRKFNKIFEEKMKIVERDPMLRLIDFFENRWC